MSRRKVTNPIAAQSRSAVDETQRELLGAATTISHMAKDLAAQAERLLAVWQAMQNAQKR